MRSRRGFALIEMMLATFLLAIGVSAVAYTIPMATRGLGKSRLMTQAAFFAQQRVEEGLTSPATPAVKVDPDVPELTGEISRVAWSRDGNLRYVRAVVYRTDDSGRTPMVELESVGTGGSSI